MSTYLATLLALEAIDRGPRRVREYTAPPESDRDEIEDRDPRSAEQFFEDEQAPCGDRR